MKINHAVLAFSFASLLFSWFILAPAEAGCIEDEVTVREQIARIWRTLDSFECRAVETIDKQSDTSGIVTTIDFCWKSEGKSALSWTRESDNETTYRDERDDGAKYIFSLFFPTPPKAVFQINIMPTRNRDKHYGGEVYSSFLMLFPGGRTLADLLDDGATLVNTGTQRTPVWSLKYANEKIQIDGVLDESHGYLPKELTLRTGPHRRVQRVTRFDQADGFWYPAEGATTFYWASVNNKPATTIALTYRVDKISLNRPIEPAKFTMSEYPAGSSVMNQIENTQLYAGGQLARTKLLREHPSPKQKVPTNEPVKVPADAGAGSRWWIEAVTIGIAVLAGALGVFFRWRGA